MSKLNFIRNINRNALLIGAAVVGVIITGVLIFASSSSNFSLSNLTLGFGTSNEQIAKKAVDYINSNGLSSETVSLVSASEESGLIKIKIKIGDKEFDSYVSKDGKFLFPQLPIDMSAKKASDSQNQNANGQSGPTKQTCDSLKKTDKPQLEAFVVARCPFGLQMQRVLADVVKNAPALDSNIIVRYMGSISNGKVTAMHGDAEAQENLRQICIRDEQHSKYWAYVSCQMKSGDTAGCEKSTGVDSSKLNACISDNNRGLAYAKKDFDLSDKYGVQGSPTLLLDGVSVSESDFGGRSTEALKSIICCASTSQPGICSTKLNTAEAAASFSDTYAGSGGSGNSGNNGANCAPAQ